MATSEETTKLRLSEVGRKLMKPPTLVKELLVLLDVSPNPNFCFLLCCRGLIDFFKVLFVFREWKFISHLLSNHLRR